MAQTGREYYEEALKAGKKEYKAKVAKNEFPYLPVLDEILKTADIRTEQNMGLVSIPLDFVVGTSTKGRTQSFASNFMPIMEPGTEFCTKWSTLSVAQLEEGIRDPIKVYEYMNRYYVVEGNKRVSVLKYFEASEINAYVIRKVPRLSEDPAIVRYYELMHFIDVTGIFNLEFTKPGLADQILALVGKDKKRWEDDDREEFNSAVYKFSKAYEFRGGKKLSITLGDAFAAFIAVFGYDALRAMNYSELNNNVLKVWSEFLVLGQHHVVDLVMDPVEQKKEEKKTSLLNLILPTAKKQLRIAFLYSREPNDSDWLYAHELGRLYLEETFPDQVTTFAVSGVKEDHVVEVMEDIISEGVDVIFCVAPQMMKPSLKVATAHPQVKIFNCSLNTPHQLIRTYYARMYEAKFISGMIAGAVAENDRVGYIADYPLFGMIANINAFALGVASTNPRAKVYLEWNTRKGYDKDAFLRENDIHIVSDQDMISPGEKDRRYGLYRYDEGFLPEVLVLPLWNWGIFYEKLVRSILDGSYQENAEIESGAQNYWWGMSSGVIDLICSNKVPYRVQVLADHIRKDIVKGDVHPFFGKIYDQEGKLRNEDEQRLHPRLVMKMDYLVENVIGSIPGKEDYIDTAKPVIEVKGVEKK